MIAAAPTFGSRLRELRHARGVSQRELAEACGIDHTYLSKLETDAEALRGYSASSALLFRLAYALKTDADELFLAARRAPPTVEHLLVTNDAARAFYRRAVTLSLSDAEWDRLRREMERMAGAG